MKFLQEKDVIKRSEEYEQEVKVIWQKAPHVEFLG